MTIRTAGLAMVAVFGLAAAAAASTSLFVGKGDVQMALGWNNAALQANASSLAWGYSEVSQAEIPCLKELDGGRREPTTMYRTFERSRTVSASVTVDARRQNQITGFNVTIGAPTMSGSEDFTCPNGWEADGDPIVTTVGGGLTVNGVGLGYTL